MQLYAKDERGFCDFNKPLDPTPARPTAVALADAMLAMQRADKALRKAKKDVPDYNPVGRDEDCYSEEQEEWNRAADALEDAVKASLTA